MKNIFLKKIMNKIVIIKNIKIDRYNRFIGLVLYEKNKDLGKKIIKSGLAWVWKFYKNIQYKKIENIAKKNKKLYYSGNFCS
ncbi:thermonuclease family protein [Blattabacterium punctulatus]|uniref:thermonuclease family protein n=1 Tax=Blattabacterium punctulatus TaxID=164514 RepID=UPI0021D3479C|nr:thermonuclease family protein [Blattabacterium punctulatus]